MKEFRVYLRALEPEDYRTTHQWRNDDEIWGMVGSPKYFVSADYEKQWMMKAISNPNEIRLGICLKEDDSLIGLASIININWINRSAQCPSLIGEKKFWGQGYGTEARLLLLQYAFYERGFERIWGLVLEKNVSSMKMAEKCGYKKEGILRNSVFKNGKFQNQFAVAVLREDFDPIAKEMGLYYK